MKQETLISVSTPKQYEVRINLRELYQMNVVGTILMSMNGVPIYLVLVLQLMHATKEKLTRGESANSTITCKTVDGSLV